MEDPDEGPSPLRSAALSGVVAGLIDLGLSLWARQSIPAAAGERWLLALACVGLVASSALLLTIVAVGARWLAARTPTRLAAVVVGTLGAMAGGTFGAALFSGTGVRRLGLRPWGVGTSLALGPLAALALWRHRARLARAVRSRAGATALGAAAAITYALHATVLVRQYPLLHGLAALAALSLMLLAGSARAIVGPLPAAAVGLVAAAAIGVTARSNGLRAALRQGAPLARYPAMAIGALRGRDDIPPAANRPPVAGPHLALQGYDLVLVTIDALRADRLRALGGRGRMPTLDALAARGIVFRRAYCATPHTSYSLASVMLGTHARSVLALPGASARRDTLATWLGEAGYVTAGFFPPAVFAVDGGRFGELRARRFGFETATEGYASARARAAEVDRWLGNVPGHRRVFVWAHLFEPHEPYESHTEHPWGATREDRYDAECSAADDGVAALREAFARRGRRALWVITADHGEEFGEHGGSFHGTTLYDEQVRVPLVLEGAGLSPGLVDEPVSLVDLAPTLLGGVGLPRPAGVRGNNLGAVILGAARDTRAFAATGSLRMVATAGDKLIVDLADNTLERYDLRRDPRELRNLADHDHARARILRGEISGWEASHATIESERSPSDPPAPAALLRAEQGDVSAALAVSELLGAGGLPMRRRAARVLGELGDRAAHVTDALAHELTARDGDLVREAGLSLALLGDRRGLAPARTALESLASTPDQPDALRAAVAVARLGDRSGTATLARWIHRADAEDQLRDRAVTALESLRDPRSLEVWTHLLADPRLAPRAAAALGALDDPRAVVPLRTALASVRYPITLRAILDALLTLGVADGASLLRDGLVALDPITEVFPLLARAREPGGFIAGFTAPVPVGPRPITRALRGGSPARAIRRVYLEVRAETDGIISLAPGITAPIRAGTHEVAIDVSRPLPHAALRLSATVPAVVLRVAAR